jgi:hypothetical protein
MNAAGDKVIAEDNYKHICLSPDVALASCGGRRATYELFTDAIEGWAVKSASLPTVEFLKCAFNKWYRKPSDPNGSIPGAFAIYPEADGMGVIVCEWGDPEIDEYHVITKRTPFIVSFSPSQRVSDCVMYALSFFAEQFRNLPRYEFETAMRSAIGQVFGLAAKLDSRLNDRVRIAVRGFGEAGRVSLDSEIAQGITFQRTKAAGLTSGYINKISQDGITLYPAKGVGDSQTLSLDSEIADGPNFQRVQSVSGHQASTNSIQSGAVNSAVATSISNKQLANTNEQVLDTLTITANGGFVEIHYGGYAVNNSGTATAGFVFRIRKGSLTGAQIGQITELTVNAASQEDWSLRGIDPSPGTGSVSYVITAQVNVASTSYVYGGGFVANRQV